MLWTRRFFREMAKEVKVRKVRSEREFIGKEGKEAKSLRAVSSHDLSTRVVSPPSLELAHGPSDENLPIAI